MGTPALLSTVPAQTPYIQYVATTGQTVFPYPFAITQDADLIVVANGTTLSTDAGYSVSNVGQANGGNITFTSGRTAGDIITLYRNIAIQRVTQITQNSGYSSSTFNAEYNNIYLLLQQLQASIALCLQVPNTNNPATATTLTPGAYAGKYLSFDSNGNPTPAALVLSGAVTAALILSLMPYSVILYGADSTGVADSTTAFNAAAAASNYVFIPPGTYKLSPNLLTFSAGVRFIGAGRNSVNLVCSAGTTNLFSWTSGSGTGGGITGCTITATGMTGGVVVSMIGQSRWIIDDVSIVGGFNQLYIQDQNVATIGHVWLNAGTGAYGLKYFGGGTAVANVLDIGKLEIGFSTNISTSPIGVLIDGDAATVNADTIAVTKGSAGLVIQNSGNLTNGPQFVTILNFQSDFAYSYGVSIDGGTGATTSHSLGGVYAQGCVAGPGITISKSARNISLYPVQITSNFKQGMYLDGRYIKVVSPHVAFNSQAGSASYPGIEIGPDSLNVSITGGLAGQWTGYAAEKQSYGVLVDAGAQHYSVVGTDLTNNVTGNYLDNALDGSSMIMALGANTSFPNRVPNGPLQPISGDFRQNAGTTFTMYFGNATNGVGLAVSAADAASVNYLHAYGHATGSAPALAAEGADNNIDLSLIPKGTGVIQINGNSSQVANGSVATTMTSLGPTGSHTTIQEWFVFKNKSGTLRYVPAY